MVICLEMHKSVLQLDFLDRIYLSELKHTLTNAASCIVLTEDCQNPSLIRYVHAHIADSLWPVLCSQTLC